MATIQLFTKAKKEDEKQKLIVCFFRVLTQYTTSKAASPIQKIHSVEAAQQYPAFFLHRPFYSYKCKQLPKQIIDQFFYGLTSI